MEISFISISPSRLQESVTQVCQFSLSIESVFILHAVYTRLRGSSCTVLPHIFQFLQRSHFSFTQFGDLKYCFTHIKEILCTISKPISTGILYLV